MGESSGGYGLGFDQIEASGRIAVLHSHVSSDRLCKEIQHDCVFFEKADELWQNLLFVYGSSCNIVSSDQRAKIGMKKS